MSKQQDIKKNCNCECHTLGCEYCGFCKEKHWGAMKRGTWCPVCEVVVINPKFTATKID
jgi:hypothetical protein